MLRYIMSQVDVGHERTVKVVVSSADGDPLETASKIVPRQSILVHI